MSESEQFSKIERSSEGEWLLELMKEEVNYPDVEVKLRLQPVISEAKIIDLMEDMKLVSFDSEDDINSETFWPFKISEMPLAHRKISGRRVDRVFKGRKEGKGKEEKETKNIEKEIIEDYSDDNCSDLFEIQYNPKLNESLRSYVKSIMYIRPSRFTTMQQDSHIERYTYEGDDIEPAPKSMVGFTMDSEVYRILKDMARIMKLSINRTAALAFTFFFVNFYILLKFFTDSSDNPDFNANHDLINVNADQFKRLYSFFKERDERRDKCVYQQENSFSACEIRSKNKKVTLNIKSAVYAHLVNVSDQMGYSMSKTASLAIIWFLQRFNQVLITLGESEVEGQSKIRKNEIAIARERKREKVEAKKKTKRNRINPFQF